MTIIGKRRRKIKEIPGIVPKPPTAALVALKMTFMGMLSKTYRKQLTYGQGIKDICKMTLELLDKANVFKTDIEERNTEVIFPNPIEETIETPQATNG
jgi:hypothetical protein